MENKSQKSLLDARLCGYRCDLTRIEGLDGRQISQILNTALSTYEHNWPFRKANGSPAKNTNLFFSTKKALFTKFLTFQKVLGHT
jgi:hypothetical protein